MAIKSYKHGKTKQFDESETAPIHLADHDGHHYYIWDKDNKPPKGGKNVNDEELKKILKSSLLFRQIKEKSGQHINTVAPIWKQLNALSDLLLLSGRNDLNKDEQEDLTKAQDLLARVKEIRKRSDEIEASFLDGVAVDYLTDKAWEV